MLTAADGRPLPFAVFPTEYFGSLLPLLEEKVEAMYDDQDDSKSEKSESSKKSGKSDTSTSPSLVRQLSSKKNYNRTDAALFRAFKAAQGGRADSLREESARSPKTATPKPTVVAGQIVVDMVSSK